MACADARAGRQLIAVVTLLVGAAGAWSQSPETAPPGLNAPAAPVRPVAPPAGRWTIAQLQAAFLQADADSDGQLSRAEAQQLAILPRGFEDLDVNKDGVLAREEYMSEG